MGVGGAEIRLGTCGRQSRMPSGGAAIPAGTRAIEAMKEVISECERRPADVVVGLDAIMRLMDYDAYARRLVAAAPGHRAL